MAKKSKAASYLSPRKIYSEDEYAEYKKQQVDTRRVELQDKLKQGRRNLEIFNRQQKYKTSKTGRLGSSIGRAFSMARPGGMTQALYQRQIPITSQNVQQEYPSRAKQTLRGSSGGKVGRPRGTYNKLYAPYGGVYMYRKLMAAKLRERRIELQRASTITPEQQMAMNQLAYRQQQSQLNMENKVIPDTSGYSNTGSFSDEINRAANLVD
jgi:hypothetical protein